MATVLHSESRRLYSWWWDSHNSPKNSKWLQENLTDMDTKVKSMIKLIEEDADSFARRAEMYYKKRPELMKLVEEFYRAYRALAERYNHATGELRHAHRTIAKAFPDQLPIELVDDSPSKSLSQDRELHTPETKFLGRALFDPDDFLDDGQELSDSDMNVLKKGGTHIKGSEGGMKKRGLKQFQEMFEARIGLNQTPNTAEGNVSKGRRQENGREASFDEADELSNENRNLKDKILLETERAGKAESEVLGLKKDIADMQAEKEDILLLYQQCLEKLSSIEAELSNAQNDSMKLSEKAGKAESEVQTLKEGLIQLEEEKNAGLIKQKEYSDKISELESMVSQVQEKMSRLDVRAAEAETEAQTLKDEIARLKLEKEEVFRQYKLCLVKISDLEIIISRKEVEVGLLKKQAETAEIEISELKKALDDLKMEKEASAFQYKCCMETISKLEKDLFSAKEDVKRLNDEVMIGTSKLKKAEEKCIVLETSNQSLRVEADNLSEMIATKDRELSEKQEEMEKLQTCLENEHLHHAEIEASLHTLENLHSQSQDEQRALTEELQDLLQKLEELEISKHGLEEEIQLAKGENETLSQTNLSSAVSIEYMQHEIGSLRGIKERLEKELSHHMGLSTSLQQEISCLKDEIKGLNTKYQDMIEQVEVAGLDPKCVGTSIMSLQNDNSKLRQVCEQDTKEKESLLRRLGNMEELFKQKVVAEGSLSDLKSDLESSREKVKELQESSQSLHGDKAALAAEKACLLSQLHSMSENMHKLLERNAVLDNSLSSAKVELEGLREKSKGLEEICELLKNERSYLLTERSNYALKLENVERKLESMEKRYMGLEQKCADVEKEKDAMHCKVVELMFSLGMEKQEKMCSQLQSENRLAGLENKIHLLQEENRWTKKESEEELEKALKAQFEISILHKFMKDMEEKNCALIVECQKHVEASKLAEKLISELEGESLEQQVESELLLDEIERLRLGIYQIFRALESGMERAPEDDKVENEQTFVHHILGSIEKMKCSISKNEDHKQQLLVENSVLLTLLEQLESKGMEIESQKINLEKEFKIMAENLARVKNEKDQLLEMNRSLKSDVKGTHQRVTILEAELGSLCVKRADLCKDYDALQEKYSQVNQENKCLMKKFSELKKQKLQVDQHNDAVLLQLIATSNESAVLRSFGSEKVTEVKLLLQDLNRQHEDNLRLEKELSVLREKLELEKAESVLLNDAVQRLELEMQGMRESSDQMKRDMLSDHENLIQTEAKLLDMELKLETAENLNSKLCSTVDELRTDVHESLQMREHLEKNVVQLSENNSIQKEEIDSLLTVNGNLKSELGVLREEIEEKIIREQTLSSELEEKNNEFELWEAEASAFYFDLQISSIHEVLFENKVQELTGVCKILETERVSKTSEIEQMQGEICTMKSEISGLKSQISAYAPVISSLKDDITLLEHNALLQTKFKKANTQEPEILEAIAHPSGSVILQEDQTLLSLQNLQMRLKAVGKLMEEMNKPAVHKRSKSNIKQESYIGEIESSKPRRSLGRDKHERISKKDYASEINETPKLQKIKTKASEVRNGMLMKDIPLDHVRKRGTSGADDEMLELWETAEDVNSGQTIGESLRMSYKMTDRDIVYDGFENAKHKFDLPLTDSDVEKELGVDKLELSTRIAEKNKEVTNTRKILERLASDHLKLENLQTTVQTLVMKLETNKTNKKSKNVDFETVNEQLLEAEETVEQLVDLNGQLAKDIQECPSPDGKASLQLKETLKKRKKKVAEQARKGSERIGRLQLELQKIQYILLKMEDDKKNKVRNKFFTSKTVVLRDFVYYGRKNSGKRKKAPFCGCFRSSTSTNGRLSP